MSAETLEFGQDDGPGAGRAHAFAPILIGLAAPVLVLLLIDPRALKSATVIAHIYLGALFVIATAAYIVSVFEPGEVTKVTCDRKERVILIERTGWLARKTVAIPFADVAHLRIETRYDDDGYKSDVANLVLSTREVIPLPVITTEAEAAAMRAVIGRG